MRHSFESADKRGPAWRDLRDVVPWLHTTVPYFVNSADVLRLQANLRTAGFEIVEIIGESIRTEPELLAALARALRFPSYFGNNWDAFDESVGREFAQLRNGPVALIWKSSDVMLAADVHAFVRSVHLLLVNMRELGASMSFQMEFFVAGSGSAYPIAGPSRPPEQ